MSANKFNRSVSFNKKNEDDVRILKFIGRKKFSRYMKDLVLAEMERKELEKQAIEEAAKNAHSAHSEVTTDKSPLQEEVTAVQKPSIYEVAERKKGSQRNEKTTQREPISKPFVKVNSGGWSIKGN